MPFDTISLVAAITAPTAPILVPSRRIAEDALALADEFGSDAPLAASVRAVQSRARDNAVAYCHWRSVERLAEWLAAPEYGATRH
jgi:hypothetical protein